MDETDNGSPEQLSAREQLARSAAPAVDRACQGIYNGNRQGKQKKGDKNAVRAAAPDGGRRPESRSGPSGSPHSKKIIIYSQRNTSGDDKTVKKTAGGKQDSADHTQQFTNLIKKSADAKKVSELGRGFNLDIQEVAGRLNNDA